MRREYVFIHLTCFLFLPYFEHVYANAEESKDEYLKGCDHLRCESGSWCVKQRFWCRDPPCPRMLYCSKSTIESLRGPSTCKTVRCSKGHVCVVKARGCRWNEKCKQKIARCVTEKEYSASCVDFECPPGKRCILREAYCVDPPCKLIGSCQKAEDVNIWLDECKSLNCVSEYECFLRRPENNRLDSCTHTSDCTLTVEDELISRYCHGWICPRSQKCVVRIVGACKGFNCTVERSCRAFASSSTRSERADEYANTKVTDEQPSRRRTLVQMESELIRQELEREMNSQTTNYPITKEEPTLATTLTQRSSSPLSTSSSSNATFSTISSAEEEEEEEEIESTTSRDAKRLETPKTMYIASDDATLPATLEGITLGEQNYPTWIKNDPYRSEVEEDRNGDGWGYYVPQEPYRILLPPFEPAILVEDARDRGQLFPFFTRAFDRPFNEVAAVISLPEVPIDTKTDRNVSTIGNYMKDPATVEAENSKVNNFDDSSGDYKSVPATERTNAILSPNIHKESDNYYDDYERLWLTMIHDYLERNEPRSSSSAHEREFKSSLVDSAMDNLYRDYTSTADVATYFARDEIRNGKRSRISATRLFIDNNDNNNNNRATFNPFITTGRSDCNTRDEKLHGLANHPYDTVSVDENQDANMKDVSSK